MFFLRSGGLRYIRRSSVTAYDFTIGSFIRDNAWHTLDLSSIVPIGCDCVQLRYQVQGSAVGLNLYFSDKDYLYGAAKAHTYLANVTSYADDVVPIDSTRKIHYLCTTSANWTNISCVIRGYWVK